MNKKIVCGVGVNDTNYTTIRCKEIAKVKGKRVRRVIWACPYYRKWTNMLKRCYDPKELIKKPSYTGCSVTPQWLYFSNFREWMINQPWEDNDLDKDLLCAGNKIYSPEACVFINSKVNAFVLDSGKTRGNYLLGCNWVKKDRKFRASCCNPLDKAYSTYVGYYDTELEAHLAWKRRKHEYACQLAYSGYVTDSRVKNALLSRYKNYTVVEDHIK